MAVSALTGCTTVQGPPAADPSAAGAHSLAPRPEGPAEPRVVQAPAREALEMIGPSRPPGRASGEPRRTARPPLPPQRKPPAARPHPEQQPLPDRSKAPERAHGSERPRLQVPDVARSAGGNADVCSLGKQYGGWGLGNPETVICEQAYGR
ncbi:hypothetical protein [Streptomyces sp. NPDC017890]|uniref:hypothetical protein n=1 Tax=Streptomyces sp. NPDC017890 TaxID=3365015 RepID=UPI0037A69CB7